MQTQPRPRFHYMNLLVNDGGSATNLTYRLESCRRNPCR